MSGRLSSGNGPMEMRGEVEDARVGGFDVEFVSITAPSSQHLNLILGEPSLSRCGGSPLSEGVSREL